MKLTAFSKSRPLVLLSEFPADAKGGAAIILRGLLREADPSAILWLTLSGDQPLDTSVWPAQIPLQRGSAGRSAFKDCTIYASDLAEEVLTIAAHRDAAAIWVVLHNAGVSIAARLVRQKRFPIHVTVNDDPPYATIMRSRRNAILLPFMARDFAAALRGADSIDTTSEPMAGRYRERYGVDSVVVHRGLIESDIHPAPEFNPAAGLSVATLGNPYNYGQLPLLAHALATAAKAEGTHAKLFVIGGQSTGQRLQKEYGQLLDIQLQGHLDEPQAITLLQSCFLLYFNYPFSWSTKALRQTSFPVKLSTYAMASRPILMHAPQDSSTAEIAKMKGYVFDWQSNDIAEGVRILSQAWRDPSLRRSFHPEAETLRKRFFDYPVLRDRLFAMLNALPAHNPLTTSAEPSTTPLIMQLDAFSPQTPLILVTEFPPDAQGGGAVLLRSLIPESDRAKIVWVSLGKTNSPSANSLQLTATAAGHFLTRRSSLAQARYEELLQIAKARGAKAIWFVAHGQVVPIAALAAAGKQFPLHITVHDDPPFATTLRSRRTFLNTFAVEREFKTALQGAQSIDVVCRQMGERYKSRYGVSSVITHRAMDPSAITPAPPYDFARHGLRIAILGNTYSFSQLPSLANAMIRAAQKAAAQASIAVFGKSLADRLATFDSRLRVELMGHLDEAAAVEQLKSCFLLYLNYPFSRITRVLRETSFPTKLSTYIMAARPILLHAPADSSTSELAGMSPYVLPWQDTKIQTGASLLISACQNPAMRESFHAQAEIVRATYYDAQSNRSALLTALSALPQSTS
jgi:glycosyltransferase involved in cell wall biosynthesis